MLRRRLVIAPVGVVFALAVLLAIWRVAFDEEPDGQAVASIDEAAGTYHGVGIGDGAAAVRRVLGPRPFARPDKEPITPTEAELGASGVPAVMDHPCKPPAGRGERPRLAVMRYEEVSFLFCDGRVFAWMVVAADARTSRGLSLGDDLEKARTLYPGLTCAEAPSGDFRRYPYCAGTIDSRGGRPRLHAWFGEDPVASITISTSAYDGYEK
jgi:hypothetical protein